MTEKKKAYVVTNTKDTGALEESLVSWFDSILNNYGQYLPLRTMVSLFLDTAFKYKTEREEKEMTRVERIRERKEMSRAGKMRDLSAKTTTLIFEYAKSLDLEDIEGIFADTMYKIRLHQCNTVDMEKREGKNGN